MSVGLREVRADNGMENRVTGLSGEFVKLRKVTIRFIIYIRLSIFLPFRRSVGLSVSLH